jgi:chaperonin GroEL
MLTTDCMIAEAPSDDKGQPGMGGGMGDMGGMDM